MMVRMVAVRAFGVVVPVVVVAVRMVVVRMSVVLQELRVDVELGVQVEAVQVEHLRDGHFAEVHTSV